MPLDHNRHPNRCFDQTGLNCSPLTEYEYNWFSIWMIDIKSDFLKDALRNSLICDGLCLIDRNEPGIPKPYGILYGSEPHL